jgi:hypothetical protein
MLDVKVNSYKINASYYISPLIKLRDDLLYKDNILF